MQTRSSHAELDAQLLHLVNGEAQSATAEDLTTSYMAHARVARTAARLVGTHDMQVQASSVSKVTEIQDLAQHSISA